MTPLERQSAAAELVRKSREFADYIIEKRTGVLKVTPEGKVKQKVTALLREYDDLYHFMPVVSGYGKRTIDYIGCYKGKFFGIETKKPGGTPTHLQDLTIKDMRSAGGKVFVIDGEDGLLELRRWLEGEQSD